MYTRKMEIRHLSSADIYNLGQILDPMQFWKKLMRIIPDDLALTGTTSDLKYTNDHIRLIECASAKDSRSCTEILIDEWGCSGRKRANLGNLLDLLVKAELFRAADFVALQLLNEPPPNRPLKGPAAKIDISIPLEAQEVKQIEEMLADTSYPGTQTLLENREVPSNLNNRDYYEKFGRHEKKIDIVYSDLMKFSSSSISSSSTRETQSTELAVSVSADIPNISALNIANSDVVIPDLSVLNVSGENTSSQDLKSFEMPSDTAKSSFQTENELNSFQIPAAVAEISNQGQANLGESDTMDLSYQPNLSLLQQDSRNESSLTNVTSTDEDNILFPSSNSISGNIPCLSALHR